MRENRNGYTGSVSHLVRIVYLRRELAHLSSTEQGHISNRETDPKWIKSISGILMETE